MENLFVAWVLINFISTYFIIIYCVFSIEENLKNVLVYPLLNNFCDCIQLNLAGKIILFILFTIFFGGALLLYYALMLFMLIMTLIGFGFVKLFKKKGK